MAPSLPQPAVVCLTVVGGLFLLYKLAETVRLLCSTYLLAGAKLSKFGSPGSWAVITGASDGIGAEYARQLASKRFNLVLVSRTASKLNALGQDIKKDNPSVEIRTHPMDFAKNNDDDYATLAGLIRDIDVAILINNVGMSHDIPTAFVETPPKEVKDITTVNVTGTLRTTQTVAPKMVEQKRGLILTMGSFGGIMPTAYLATYSGTKAFLQYWSSALGAELEEAGVTVQFLNSYMVTSAMSKIKRTSLAVPSPKYFVKSALSSIGRSGASQGIGYTGTPYHSHSLLHWYIRKVYGTMNLHQEEGISKKGKRRKEAVDSESSVSFTAFIPTTFIHTRVARARGQDEGRLCSDKGPTGFQDWYLDRAVRSSLVSNTRMPSTHNREKEWDDDTVDKWHTPKFTPADNPAGPFASESTFTVLFPKYRERYLQESWPLVIRALSTHGIASTLDLINGCMHVRTTRKTFDPGAILNARDAIKLLSRSVPAPQALRLLEEDGCAADVIKIRNLVRNKERFAKRRQRILGPGGSTLKALELLTGCYILVQGNTVSALGPYKGLKEVRRVVEDALRNVHPIYHIKELMIKRELAKDPDLANESWDRFLPNFKKKTLAKRHKPHKVTDKSAKEYNPFPPPREQSKLDKQIESGEYFLTKEAKERAKRQGKVREQREKQGVKRKEKEQEFVPPEEEGGGGGNDGEDAKARKKDKKKGKKRRRTEEVEEGVDQEYGIIGVEGGGEAADAGDGGNGKKKRKKHKARDSDGEYSS
ncbi:MAG: hypothetical protein M1831_005148 [Alyxoria varia]|nr:MAG: hypothetical protein M1831_005148 [Alyxoria varia]